jgi:predicted protein tyrosine phosphatase
LLGSLVEIPCRALFLTRSAWSRPSLKNVLFVCGQNRLRSPTAEQVFAQRADLEVASAGTNNDADVPLSSELIDWADLIVVMEKQHRAKIQKRFRQSLNGKRIICLDIPDDYEFMEPALVNLLEARLARYLPEGGHA